MSPFPDEQPGISPIAAQQARNAAVLQEAGAAPVDPGLASSAAPGSPPTFGRSIDWADENSDAHLSSAAVVHPSQALEDLPAAPPDLHLAEKRDASAANKHRNVKCPECDTTQSATHKKCSSCGHDLEKARAGKFANYDQGPHAAKIYDPSLKLAVEKDDESGLVWKAICKTGELALSPGPGQIDVETPLKLTPELFDDLVMSVEEQAFPYVTVPVSHANGLLENTGYVRKLETRESNDGERELWAGIEFTEPDIAEKVNRGTIPDTSVGVKFNYRNKRSGKEYAAALEHVALTHQPWVDGLTPFGQSLSQEQPYDQEAAEAAQVSEDDFDGIFIPRDTELSQTEPKRQSRRRSGDILPSSRQSRRMRRTVKPGDRQTRRQPPARTATRPEDAKTVEELMASQQAQIEVEKAAREKAEQDLALSQGRISSLETTNHRGEIERLVTQWQGAHVPPSVCREAEALLMAIGPEAPATEDEHTLQLSVTKPAAEEGGDPTIEQIPLNLSQVVKRLVGAVPTVAVGDVIKIADELDELNASQSPAEKSAKEKADAIYEAAQERQEGPQAPAPAGGDK